MVDEIAQRAEIKGLRRFLPRQGLFGDLMHSLSGSSAQKGVAAIFGFIATTAAAIVGAVLAVLVAGALVIIGVIASVMIGLAAMAMGARRAARAKPAAEADPDVIEARRVGGHSWVAYGWDGQRQG